MTKMVEWRGVLGYLVYCPGQGLPDLVTPHGSVIKLGSGYFEVKPLPVELRVYGTELLMDARRLKHAKAAAITAAKTRVDELKVELASAQRSLTELLQKK